MQEAIAPRGGCGGGGGAILVFLGVNSRCWVIIKKKMRVTHPGPLPFSLLPTVSYK